MDGMMKIMVYWIINNKLQIKDGVILHTKQYSRPPKQN